MCLPRKAKTAASERVRQCRCDAKHIGSMPEDRWPVHKNLLDSPCGAKVRVVASLNQGRCSLRTSNQQLILRNLHDRRNPWTGTHGYREKREGGLVPDQTTRLSTSSPSPLPLLTQRACRSRRDSKAGGVGKPLADSAGSTTRWVCRPASDRDQRLAQWSSSRAEASFVETPTAAPTSARAELTVVSPDAVPLKQVTRRSDWERRYTGYLRITDFVVVCGAVLLAQYLRFGNAPAPDNLVNQYATVYSAVLVIIWLCCPGRYSGKIAEVHRSRNRRVSARSRRLLLDFWRGRDC